MGGICFGECASVTSAARAGSMAAPMVAIVEKMDVRRVCRDARVCVVWRSKVQVQV